MMGTKINTAAESILRTATNLILASALIFSAAHANADDIPKRKSGLWEIKNTMTDVPQMAAMGPIQQCIDEKSDELMKQAVPDKNACTDYSFKRSGDRLDFTSTCKHGTTTTKTKGVFTGDFTAHYKGDVQVTYDPPIQGKRDMKMVLEARWLGACKAGMKPGDIMMPNGMVFNPGQMRGTK